MVTEASSERAVGRSVGADILRMFVQFPDPLALATLDGDVLMVNAAFAARCAQPTALPDVVRDAIRQGSPECYVALGSPDADQEVLARARVVRLPERALVVLESLARGPERRDELSELRDRVVELEQLAATDHLTGAWNRAHFDRVIAAELPRSLACRQPVSLVLLDVDHFKRINDTFGHSVGDSVLRELVRLVQSRTRASDVVFRWGGEELVVLASSAGYRGAERLAENLRRAVAEHAFVGAGSVTASFGVAEHFGNEDAAGWFRRLDESLYAAKLGGRDRVVVDRRGNSDAWISAAGGSLLHLTWQEAYECGERTIDDEHRELSALANVLLDAAARGETEPAVFRSALDELLVHLQRHFTDEEGILALHQYPDLEAHKRAHAGLLRRARHLKARAQLGEATLGAVVEFLAQDVVARHMMAVDRAFYPLFERSRPPAATAATR